MKPNKTQKLLRQNQTLNHYNNSSQTHIFESSHKKEEFTKENIQLI